MDRVLIISTNKKAAEMLSILMNKCGNFEITVSQTFDYAQKLFLNVDFDLLLINASVADDTVEQFTLTNAANTNTPIILLLPADTEIKKINFFNKNGIPVITKPIDNKLFSQLLVLTSATRRRLLGLINENQQLFHELEELKLLNRAKFVLMQYLSLTESQAHKYIEKQAMDMRCTKIEIAKSILKTYEMF